MEISEPPGSADALNAYDAMSRQGVRCFIVNAESCFFIPSGWASPPANFFGARGETLAAAMS
jgi:hypothetical protein